MVSKIACAISPTKPGSTHAKSLSAWKATGHPHSENNVSSREGLRRITSLPSSFGASTKPCKELRVCGVGCVGEKWYLQKGWGLVKISREKRQPQCQESAGLGVRGTLGLRQHYRKVQDKQYLRSSFCCGRSQATMKNASSCFSLFLQSGHLPEMSSHVVRDIGFWLWWQFLWPFLQAILGVWQVVTMQ